MYIDRYIVWFHFLCLFDFLEGDRMHNIEECDPENDGCVSKSDVQTSISATYRDCGHNKDTM